MKRSFLLFASLIVALTALVCSCAQRPSISTMLDLSAEDVQHLLISREFDTCDDPHSNKTQWTLVTDEAQIETVFDIFARTHIEVYPINSPAETPCGGYRRSVTCMLQSGSEIAFCFDDQHMVYEDSWYSVQNSRKGLGDQLDTLLADNEFVPYVDMALQGYLPLYISNLADVQLEEIKTILVSKRIDSCAEDGMPLHWAQVTDSMDKQALYLLLHEEELAAPDDTLIEWPAGGGPQYVTYILKDGTRIEMSIFEKHVFGVGDAYYEFRDQLRNELPSMLNEILADYEFAPLE